MSDTKYTFKKIESKKLKSPEYMVYDDKGAAFIIAPFVSRAKELEPLIARIIECLNRATG